MNHLTREYVTKLKDSLLFINAVVIIYNASLFLLSTKYISVHYYARDFLNKVSYITRTPQNIFFESIFLFIIIVLLMKLREKDNLKMANGLVYIEIILSFLLIIRLNGSYNGILLFVFADLLYNMRNIKHMALLLLIAFGLLLISDFNILSNIIHMPSIESYLSFYPNSSRTFMLFAKNILASLNVVVFILYLICQVLVQQEETKKISKELQLASKVNDELKTYSALSEKMAKDKERKRISREIHDTLGHALTGISAGIDACIALIDIDPQKSKEQLLVISNVVRESIKDVRRSLYKLRPGALDQRTLKDGLIKMIEEFQSVSHLNVDLYYEWENVDFENTKEDIIFRIIQETMTNALRHGHASHIEIHLFDEEEKYMIIMQDNGSGCKEIHYGYGLKQMHERVAILNGTIYFYSEEGFRTVIPILLGIALGMSTGGSPLGAIMYIIVWNLFAYFGMKFLYFKGYELGGKAVDFLVGPQGEALRESVTMLGGIVIGAVSATWISVTTSFTMTAAGAKKPFLDLQKTLDGVYPGLLTAVFVVGCWYLLSKKKMSPIKVMLLLVVVAFIGVFVGFFNPGLSY